MTSKPEWVTEWYATYEDIVNSWGYEVLDYSECGSYQGDILVLLADGARRGFTVFGYGSCSGCDALEDVSPRAGDDDWTGVIGLRDDLLSEVKWFDSAAELADHIQGLDKANHWWLHDKEIEGVIQGYVEKLRAGA